MQIDRGMLVLVGFVLSVQATTTLAHHSGDHAVVLHTNNKWDECAMVLDPSLTQSEWGTFTRDIASILYFKPTTGAKPLGKGNFEIAYQGEMTEPLKDYKGSWNNTFSHPSSEHWLVGDSHRLTVPVLNARAGLTDRIDIGLVYTSNVEANYGWMGFDAKYAFLHVPERQIFVAGRASLVKLIRAADLDYYQVAVDLLATRDFSWAAPYVGIAALYSVASEHTSKVDLHDEHAAAVHAILGSTFRWKSLRIGLEYDAARIQMYTLKLGVGF